ncbi:uncharacterized protein LOC144112780 [Amblyomma americanum]
MPSAVLWTFLPTYLVQLWSTRSARAAADQFRQLMQKLFKVHFLGGLWLLHLDASCCAVASSGRQGASLSLPKEKLQSLALAVSAQLLQTAEDIKWILAEQNLVPSCCHYCRQYKGSESCLSAWHRWH